MSLSGSLISHPRGRQVGAALDPVEAEVEAEVVVRVAETLEHRAALAPVAAAVVPMVVPLDPEVWVMVDTVGLPLEDSHHPQLPPAPAGGKLSTRLPRLSIPGGLPLLQFEFSSLLAIPFLMSVTHQ